MSLTRRNNWLPTLLDDMFNGDWLDQKDHSSYIGKNIPAVNVKETDNHFEVEVAAPGMKKEDFKIELNHDLLSISTEVKEEQKSENEHFTRREFSYGAFKRSFNLPDSVEAGKIAATYEEGVLKINLPKREEAKVQPKRMIEIA